MDFLHQGLGFIQSSLLLAHEFSTASYQTPYLSGSFVLTIDRFVFLSTVSGFKNWKLNIEWILMSGDSHVWVRGQVDSGTGVPGVRGEPWKDGPVFQGALPLQVSLFKKNGMLLILWFFSWCSRMGSKSVWVYEESFLEGKTFCWTPSECWSLNKEQYMKVPLSSKMTRMRDTASYK